MVTKDQRKTVFARVELPTISDAKTHGYLSMRKSESTLKACHGYSKQLEQGSSSYTRRDLSDSMTGRVHRTEHHMGKARYEPYKRHTKLVDGRKWTPKRHDSQGYVHRSEQGRSSTRGIVIKDNIERPMRRGQSEAAPSQHNGNTKKLKEHVQDVSAPSQTTSVSPPALRGEEASGLKSVIVLPLQQNVKGKERGADRMLVASHLNFDDILVNENVVMKEQSQVIPPDAQSIEVLNEDELGLGMDSITDNDLLNKNEMMLMEEYDLLVEDELMLDVAYAATFPSPLEGNIIDASMHEARMVSGAQDDSRMIGATSVGRKKQDGLKPRKIVKEKKESLRRGSPKPRSKQVAMEGGKKTSQRSLKNGSSSKPDVLMGSKNP